ncbi:MAG: cupin domain-containing protein [Rhizobiaceae bacterium]|nr:cupin domain-containing protein [Rhizobiaceae bacterium]
MTAQEIIAALELSPHPEGGWYTETLRDNPSGGRGHSTAIYFLLEQGQISAWHRVKDAAEVWHFYAGAPLLLSVAPSSGPVEAAILGAGIKNGERPQAVVPAGYWQSARSLGDWTLAGCTVAPGFDFSGFEMAAPGWEPGQPLL